MSEALSSTEHADEAVGRLVRLVVPQLGDWSFVTIIFEAIVSVDGEVTFLDSHEPDLPLGIVDDAPRHGRETLLDPGSTVVLYTDGVTERRNRDIDQGLGELQRALKSLAGRDPESLLDALLADLVGHSSHNDDMALLAIRVAGRST